MKDDFNYVDVDNLDELPKVDNSKRYLEFLGGSKTYRCFVVSKKLPRCDFYKNHLELLEPFLHPIFKNRGIIVAQDNTFSLPGFYILSYDKQYNSIDEIPESLSIRTNYLLKEIRKLMREKLGINFVNIYYEEKNSKSNNVHYWIMPKTQDINCSLKLYELDMQKYLSGFAYSKNKSKIIKYNEIMKKSLMAEKYYEFDDILFNKYEKIEKKINLCISNHCFIKCRGCYNNFSTGPEISYEKISSFLEYAKDNGLERVTISGGDPLTRPDISLIIKKCLDLKIKINLDTVGLPLIGPKKVLGNSIIIDKLVDYNLLKKISIIGIPLDGSNNDIISKFRIHENNLFNEMVDILNLFEKEGIKVCINTVLHKQNIDDIENIFEILNGYNCVKKWQLFQFMPIGPLGKKNEKTFSIEKEDIEKVRKILKNKKSTIRIEIKDAVERSHNYMLVDSSGKAYKVDLNNTIDTYGNICDENTWENIMQNLF